MPDGVSRLILSVPITGGRLLTNKVKLTNEVSSLCMLKSKQRGVIYIAMRFLLEY